MAARKAPQDHKAKVGLFTFTGADGKTYTLPPASNALGKLPTREFRNAVMEGGAAEIRFNFRALEVVGADQEALDALYDLSLVESGKIIQAWMSSKAEPEDATVPES